MTPITPCIWLDGNVDEAVDHYLSIFPDSRRTSESKYGPEGPGEEGTTMVVTFEIKGQPFMALNGGSAFKITPAISFVVNCATQEEIDHYWDRLLEGGEAMQCGWLTDQFGVSWQIVPERLAELFSGLDQEASRRVMQAMFSMVKLDLAELEAAAGS